MADMRGGKLERRLVRLVEILNTFAAFNVVTTYQLRERFGVSTRTIQRDIRFLREIGFSIREISPKSGRYFMAMGNWSLVSVEKAALDRLGYRACDYEGSLFSRLPVGSPSFN